jgi:hypothetical protein
LATPLDDDWLLITISWRDDFICGLPLLLKVVEGHSERKVGHVEGILKYATLFGICVKNGIYLQHLNLCFAAPRCWRDEVNSLKTRADQIHQKYIRPKIKIATLLHNSYPIIK